LEDIKMVFEKVAKILADYKGCEEDDIKLETSLEELGLDSLDTVELIMSFEEEFEISIEADESLKTVNDIVSLIESKLA
jgi:acyl carrier protein